MAAIDSKLTDLYAIYRGDCCQVLPDLPEQSVHLSIYSPPFRGLYHYSSSDEDLSNARSPEEFFRHYEFVVREVYRVTIPGRLSAVHCCDIPLSNTGVDTMYDFGAEIIRLHERVGWSFTGRHAIWKEPLAVRNRTMAKNLAHKTIVEDSTRCAMASADWLLRFRKPGHNPVPVSHPEGLLEYAGERKIPHDVLSYRGYTGKQTENRYSHWIWRQYASSFWDDIRSDRVLPYRTSRDEDDEKHVHPLQLDVIDRMVVLGSNPGETVMTPFMGVGSEVYAAVVAGRRGVGIELKPSYYQQAIKNMEAAEAGWRQNRTADLFGALG